MSSPVKPFIEHVQELKSRVLNCLLFVALGSLAGYMYYPSILSLLLHPLNQQLYYSSPTGGFDLMVKVCVFSGLLLAVPVVIYHVFQFLAPVLPRQTHWTLVCYVVASCCLLVTGISFAYLVCLPAALRFLGEFGSAQVASLISAPEYFSFIIRYMLGFGVVFQLPLVLLLLNSAYRVPAAQLWRHGRYVILGSFIFSAVLSSTPDAVNQTMIAVPVILLYYGSICMIWLINRNYPATVAP